MLLYLLEARSVPIIELSAFQIMASKLSFLFSKLQAASQFTLKRPVGGFLPFVVLHFGGCLLDSLLGIAWDSLNWLYCSFALDMIVLGSESFLGGQDHSS